MPQRQLTAASRFELEFATALGRLEGTLRKVSHADFATEMRRFQRRRQSLARSAFVRREIARRVAERIVSRACLRAEPAATVTAELKRMVRLGFSNVEKRVHIAAMLSRWVELGGEGAPLVQPFIEDSLSRIRRVRRGRYRKALLESLPSALTASAGTRARRRAPRA